MPITDFQLPNSFFCSLGNQKFLLWLGSQVQQQKAEIGKVKIRLKQKSMNG